MSYDYLNGGLFYNFKYLVTIKAFQLKRHVYNTINENNERIKYKKICETF